MNIIMFRMADSVIYSVQRLIGFLCIATLPVLRVSLGPLVTLLCFTCNAEPNIALYRSPMLSPCQESSLLQMFVRDPLDCSQFYTCFGNRFWKMSCTTPGTVYSIKFKVCVWRDSLFDDCSDDERNSIDSNLLDEQKGTVHDNEISPGLYLTLQRNVTLKSRLIQNTERFSDLLPRTKNQLLPSKYESIINKDQYETFVQNETENLIEKTKKRKNSRHFQENKSEIIFEDKKSADNSSLTRKIHKNSELENIRNLFSPSKSPFVTPVPFKKPTTEALPKTTFAFKRKTPIVGTKLKLIQTTLQPVLSTARSELEETRHRKITATPWRFISRPPTTPSTPQSPQTLVKKWMVKYPTRLPVYTSYQTTNPPHHSTTPSSHLRLIQKQTTDQPRGRVTSTPRQLPSTPRQLPSTPRQLPSTPRQLPSTPRQLPSTQAVTQSPGLVSNIPPRLQLHDITPLLRRKDTPGTRPPKQEELHLQRPQSVPTPLPTQETRQPFHYGVTSLPPLQRTKKPTNQKSPDSIFPHSFTLPPPWWKQRLLLKTEKQPLDTKLVIIKLLPEDKKSTSGPLSRMLPTTPLPRQQQRTKTTSKPGRWWSWTFSPTRQPFWTPSPIDAMTTALKTTTMANVREVRYSIKTEPSFDTTKAHTTTTTVPTTKSTPKPSSAVTTTISTTTSTTPQPTTTTPLPTTTTPLTTTSTTTDAFSSLSTLPHRARMAEHCGIMSRPMIIGGRPSHPGQWPWQVSLQIIAAVEPWHRCGGVLIHPSWVLTAAHCVEGPFYGDVRNWRVVLAEDNLEAESGREIYRRIGRIVSHPGYIRTSNFPNDVALLQLDEGVDLTTGEVRVACLPDQDTPPPDLRHCWISGWGETRGSGGVENAMNELPVHLLDNEDCASMWLRVGIHVLDDQLCVGYGDTGACYGDSGGPLMCEQDGRFYITGVMSWLINNCSARGFPNVFTRVTSYMDWVYEKLDFYEWWRYN